MHPFRGAIVKARPDGALAGRRDGQRADIASLSPRSDDGTLDSRPRPWVLERAEAYLLAQLERYAWGPGVPSGFLGVGGAALPADYAASIQKFFAGSRTHMESVRALCRRLGEECAGGSGLSRRESGVKRASGQALGCLRAETAIQEMFCDTSQIDNPADSQI